MKPRIIDTAAWIGNALESTLSALRTGRPSRAPRQLRIIGYRSLGSSTSLVVRGRVVYQAASAARTVIAAELPAGARRVRSHQQLIAVYRAFDVEDITGAEVRVCCDSISATTTTDDGGFFELELPAASESAGWLPGWHRVSVRCNLSNDVVTTDVLVPDASAALLIISDLDDTAMDTQTMSSWRMLRTVLFRNAHRRQSVPGVPALYQALHHGNGKVLNPICYISSGAWNLYDAVVEYLDMHGLPRGGVLLNDWGSRMRHFRTVAHQHKSTHIANLINCFPAFPILLIGDDTQEDPELYAFLARQYPGRVAAIWIRAVHTALTRADEVRQVQDDLAATGTEFVYAAASETFAACAVKRGWITPG